MDGWIDEWVERGEPEGVCNKTGYLWFIVGVSLNGRNVHVHLRVVIRTEGNGKFSSLGLAFALLLVEDDLGLFIYSTQTFEDSSHVRSFLGNYQSHYRYLRSNQSRC